MRSGFESGVFGKEKDGSFESAISQIGKGFDEEDFYPTLEEKAATLLYLIVKNHGFVDGKQRILFSGAARSGTSKLAFLVSLVYYYTIITQKWPDKQ